MGIRRDWFTYFQCSPDEALIPLVPPADILARPGLCSVPDILEFQKVKGSAPLAKQSSHSLVWRQGCWQAARAGLSGVSGEAWSEVESWWARARADGQTVDVRNGTLQLGILGWACATVDVFLCACVRRGRDAFVRASECGRSVRASESGASVRASESDASARSTVNEHASAEETSENAL